MERKFKIGSVVLDHPIMNAAGTCKLLGGSEGVKSLANSSVSAIMVGSATKLARDGNSGTTYHEGPWFSLNSLGMPNPGLEGYRSELPDMVKVAHDNGKKLFMSVAGFSPEEYAELAEFALEMGVDGVELNFGCPNIWTSFDGLRLGRQKDIASFSPELSSKALEAVEAAVGEDANVGVKVSPYSNPAELPQMAKLMTHFAVVKFITTMNTFPNAFVFETDRQAIAVGDGLAGMAGEAVRPMAMGQVIQWRNALKKLDREYIDVIGVGGVASGAHVKDYLSLGASAVQVATAFVNRGKQVFFEILSHYVDLCETE